MGMDADRTPYGRLAIRDREHLVEPAEPRADRDHRSDASRVRPPNGVGAVFLERVEMAVAVDEHQAALSSKRGKTGVGFGNGVPGASASPTVEKPRAPGSTPS